MWQRKRKDSAAPLRTGHAGGDAEHTGPDEAPNEADRRLRELWEASAPDEPALDVWAGLFARIETDLAAGPAAVPPGPGAGGGGGWGRLLWRGGMAAASIAAVLLLFLFGRGPKPLPTPAPDSPPEDVWEVLAPHEVSIVSIEGDDGKLLVVGKPPIQGPIVLMEPGDVIVQNIEPHPHDGMIPDLHKPQGSSPMLVAPLNWGDR